MHLFEIKGNKKVKYSGSLDLSGTQITNYPVIYDCGDEKRVIYIDLEDKTKIHIGCFSGTQQDAIKAVNDKYGKNNLEYISKINACFDIMKNKGK